MNIYLKKIDIVFFLRTVKMSQNWGSFLAVIYVSEYFMKSYVFLDLKIPASVIIRKKNESDRIKKS